MTTSLPDPYGDLTVCKPAPKPATEGGIGRKKAKKPLTAQFIDQKAEKRARATLTACRVCPNEQGYRVEPHHIVRRGAPHFGTWDRQNILALCLACHTAYHSGDEVVRKAIRLELTREQVEWSDSAAFQGYVDTIYWPLPKDVHGQSTVGCELLAALPKEAA